MNSIVKKPLICHKVLGKMMDIFIWLFLYDYLYFYELSGIVVPDRLSTYGIQHYLSKDMLPICWFVHHVAPHISITICIFVVIFSQYGVREKVHNMHWNNSWIYYDIMVPTNSTILTIPWSSNPSWPWPSLPNYCHHYHPIVLEVI